MFRRKRIYEAVEESDGYRVLVDRLWPRGVKKEDAQLDAWPKEIAPSKDLRQAFHRADLDFEDFSQAYEEELEGNEEIQETCSDLARRARDHRVTLLYASKNEEENHVLVLEAYLASLLKGIRTDLEGD
ncbi:DUF488 domain-containing protein [Aerococcus sanguinicola]|uniref:DUF488 domain-containing protein n=1 Tax=unclassified Aerococcus TaxID=2618060 RepID=UPI0008A4B796|nr:MULTISPECIES: DUF488 family protein [unclassified Aerococcus]MDK6233947.1 DUF488 family protein [Aerococcus sp. UMB10185]MDK6856336.1 DUF488 family protein [Aerococcus sp. UMB7533]MDK8502693.1 DUF488 family protein [Aerococcus sp. UMB1112A]OFN04167.1 hypothetical protein HMPREF2626_04510 [Aerococcus sp. HMSC062A02]OHO43103.1 hypothetical protein HMPREF2705_08735 [Aerococcus sp. HMSC035B07]